MSGQAWDNVALFCLFAALVSPLYIIPIFWKRIQGGKTKKFFIGLLIAVGFAIVLGITGFAIMLRNGIGWR